MRYSFSEVQFAARKLWTWAFDEPWPDRWYVYSVEFASSPRRWGAKTFHTQERVLLVISPRMVENLLHEFIHMRGFVLHNDAFVAELTRVRARFNVGPDPLLLSCF